MRELVWVAIALFFQKRRNAGNAGNARNTGRIPGRQFGRDIIMVLAPFGTENDGTFSWKFDFEGQIYLTVESTCFAHLSDIWFWGPNLPKSWNTYVCKVHCISLDSPRESKSSPRASKDLPGGFNSAPGEVQDLFRRQILYIFKFPINRKAAITCQLQFIPVCPIGMFRVSICKDLASLLRWTL